MASLAAPRRFAYYDRLSAKDRATYRRSDAISAVPLTDVPALRALVTGIEEALGSGKRVRVAKAVTAFIVAFLAQTGAPGLKVHVREVRPDLEDAELHGLYTFADGEQPPKLEVWMRTRALAQVVRPRTFVRTVVHELLHHLDVTIFALEESFHTEGFFRRESSVVRAFFGEARAPKATQMSLFGGTMPPGRPPGDS
ncbi:hypothetical protein BH11MYX4_BH11MYX4_60070 [soil metagenome]